MTDANREDCMDHRSKTPEDLTLVNTTTMEEPLGKMVCPSDDWMMLGTTPVPQFLVEHETNPFMDALGQWISRSNIVIPMGIQPVVKHRILSSAPESGDKHPTDEWFQRTLIEALIFVWKTGNKKDSQRAAALHAVIAPTKSRAGLPSTAIHFGEPITGAEYSSQSLSIGNLFWTGVDFGETTHLGNKLRADCLSPTPPRGTNVRYYT